MSSYYYLNQYGTNNGSFLDANKKIYSNNFLGAMLDYNKLDLGSVGFLFENGLQDPSNPSAIGVTNFDFTSFYTNYKTIVGSDIMSYTNKYSNTNSMAMGDLMNWGSNQISTPSTAYSPNVLSADATTFSFRQTKDGNPYRYTESTEASGTFIAGDEFAGGRVSTYNGGDDQVTKYQTYYDYKINQFDGKTANIATVFSAANLTKLGIDYASISAAAGGDATKIKAIYTNLVNQLTSELKAIKPGTISEADRITMEQSLKDKQVGLKAIDDALYGYTTATTKELYSYEMASFDFSTATPAASVMAVANDTQYRNSVISVSTKGTNETGKSGNEYLGKYFASSNDLADYKAIINGTTPPNGKTAIDYWDGDDSDSNRIKYTVTNATKAYDATAAINDLYKNKLGKLSTKELDGTSRTNFDEKLTDSIKGWESATMPSDEITLTSSLSDTQKKDIYDCNSKTDMLAYVKNNASLSEADQINAVNSIYADKIRNKFVADLAATVKSSIGDSDISHVRGTVTEDIPAITDRVTDINRICGDATFTMSLESQRILKKSIEWQFERAGMHDGLNMCGHIDSLTCGARKNAGDWADEILKGLGLDIANGDTTGKLDLQGKTFTEALRDLMVDKTSNSCSHSNEWAIGHVMSDIAGLNLFENYSADGGMDYRKMKTDTETKTITFAGMPFSYQATKVDDNSLVAQLAKEIPAEMKNLTMFGASGEDYNALPGGDPQEAANYIAEITAGIMEQYWIENFNKKDAEAITDYFEREFRSYFNPKGISGIVPCSYKVADGSFVKFDLNFDEDAKSFGIVDRIVQSQTFAQIYSKMEDRSRGEMELFEASAALDVVQNVNTQEYLFRLNMLAALEKEASDHLGATDTKTIFAPVTRNLVELGPGASKNPWWQEYFPWFKGFYGTLPEGATAEDMFDKDGKIKASMVSKNGALIDPYIVKINDVDYVMGVDGNKDGKINGAQEVLGINDTVATSFTSLKSLDLNADGTVSQDELKQGGIVFEALNVADRLSGAQIKTDFIKSIDLGSLQNADGTNGIFGTFEVQLANGKKAGAIQTFETQDYFNNLFGTYVDMSFLSKAEAAKTEAKTTAIKAAETTVQTKTETPKTEVAKNKFDIKTIQAKQYNFFTDIDDADQKEEPAKSTTSNKLDINTFKAKQYNFFSYLDNIEQTQSNSATTAAKTEEKAVATPIAIPVIKSAFLDVNKQPVVNVDNKEMTVDALIDDLCWKMNVERLTVKQRYDILGSVDTTQSSDIIIQKIQERLSKTQFSA